VDKDPSPSGAALDFERAEFAPAARAAATSCAFCRQDVGREYWQVGSALACGRCRQRLGEQFARGDSRAAFLRAFGNGAVVALGGSVLWIVIAKVTELELGIIAIGIGYFVGKAVRMGSQGLGGPRYQALAMFLTYSAIVLASLPMILGALAQGPHDAAAAAVHPSLVGMLISWTVIIGLAYASPFLGGVRNVMGIVIIGIGLYEAWKLTRRVPLAILGPYQVAPSVPAAGSIAADAAPARAGAAASDGGG